MKTAIRHLAILGALDFKDQSQIESYLNDTNQSGEDPTKVNKLGSLLSKIPISPKFAKMLVVASKYGVLRYTIMMVACMSVSEIFNEVQSLQQMVQAQAAN